MKTLKIETEDQYNSAFLEIDKLIMEGFEGNSEKEQLYKSIAEGIQLFEQSKFHFPIPTTLIGMIELKMFQLKFKQRDLARILEIKESRVSEILNGKRRINIEIATKLYKNLQIDPAFILNSI